MATNPKTKIGHMACLCCGEKIPVKESESGTLNLSCPECDFTGYVKRGTDAYKKASARITMLAGPAPVAAPAPAAPPKAKTAPVVATAPVRNTIFG